MKLENWSVIVSTSNPYQAPELAVARLQGYVYGHPRHSDGKHVITSRIVSAKGDRIVTGSGSEYHLGEVDKDYEKTFPNAKVRLFREVLEGK